MNIIKKFKIFEKYYNKELNQNFWKDTVLDEKLREKLLTISYDFFNSLKLNKEKFPNINNNVEIKDIILTGSLANYTYNKYSDFDLHILIDYNDIDENYEIVKKMLNDEKYIWNIQHQITIQGHDIEVYVQDINEEHNSSGQYSILYNKWIIKPIHKEPKIKEKEINKIYNKIIEKINKLYKLNKNNISPEESIKYYNYSNRLFKQIIKMRRNSLSEYGEFSIGNLTFKKLRNSQYIKKLKDLKTNFYDKIYIQK